MVIPQVGLPADLLPTVTAFIAATPNLGGVLGVGIIGTGTSHYLLCLAPLADTNHSVLVIAPVINNAFRTKLASAIGEANIPLNINDAVSAARSPAYGAEVVRAYVAAFRLGFQILAGIAVFQFLLCLLLGKVVVNNTSVSKEGDEDTTDVAGGDGMAMTQIAQKEKESQSLRFQNHTA